MKQKMWKNCIGDGISVSKLLDVLFCSQKFRSSFTIFVKSTPYLIKFQKRRQLYSLFLRQNGEKKLNKPHMDTNNLQGIQLKKAEFYNQISSN